MGILKNLTGWRACGGWCINFENAGSGLWMSAKVYYVIFLGRTWKAGGAEARKAEGMDGEGRGKDGFYTVWKGILRNWLQVLKICKNETGEDLFYSCG